MNTKKTSVVLVEKDVAEKENFIQLAQKEDWNIEAFGSSYEAIQYIKKNTDVDLAVISENATPLNAHQYHDYIRNEIKLKFPVVIAASESKDDGFTYIAKPFTQQAINKLNQLLNTDENVAPAANKVYSLEYLETIAGGNQDFLIDCLKTFISSVSGKMSELKIAVASNDLKDIGAIAHNIKPSFEMLESEIGKNICNKLTYESETSDIPTLAAQLEKEFITIEAALKNDFSELR